MAIQMRMSTPKQLVPGLMGILGQAYKAVDEEHKVLFEMGTSNRAYEEEVMMSGLGLGAVKEEGGNIGYDSMEELWTARYTHETIALGFIITEEAIEDNLYENYANKASKALGRSLAETKQIKAAAVFNNGFNPTYKGGDGQPLFSTTHPTKVGTLSNSTNVDLSEAALEDQTISIARWTDDRGLLVSTKPIALHVPVELQFVAERLLKSTLRPTALILNGSGAVTAGTGTASSVGITNSNEVNALKSKGLYSNLNIHLRFTDPEAWFIKTDQVDGTKHLVRRKLRFDTDGDFQTGNSMCKGSERYSFGWSDWRQWSGSSGA
jgi:hypothetical protein